jgi:hypothetical protein
MNNIDENAKRSFHKKYGSRYGNDQELGDAVYDEFLAQKEACPGNSDRDDDIIVTKILESALRSTQLILKLLSGKNKKGTFRGLSVAERRIALLAYISAKIKEGKMTDEKKDTLLRDFDSRHYTPSCVDSWIIKNILWGMNGNVLFGMKAPGAGPNESPVKHMSIVLREEDDGEIICQDEKYWYVIEEATNKQKGKYRKKDKPLFPLGMWWKDAGACWKWIDKEFMNDMNENTGKYERLYADLDYSDEGNNSRE